jgi:hypothetical protein
MHPGAQRPTWTIVSDAHRVFSAVQGHRKIYAVAQTQHSKPRSAFALYPGPRVLPASPL